MKRVIGMVVAIIGVASLVMGIVFVVEANSGKQQVADDIAPLALTEVKPSYDTVTASNLQAMAAEEPRYRPVKLPRARCIIT